MHIRSLVDCLDDLPELARFHHEEWSHVSPFKTQEQHVMKLRARIGASPIPATYILYVSDEVAGSVSLLQQDDIAQVRSDLSPWLSSLLVVSKYRGRGYGRALVQHCVTQASIAGFPALYLHTDTHAEYYARLGWREISREVSFGVEATVMKLELNGPGT